MSNVVDSCVVGITYLWAAHAANSGGKKYYSIKLFDLSRPPLSLYVVPAVVGPSMHRQHLFFSFFFLLKINVWPSTFSY
jgi:hypothetical protein